MSPDLPTCPREDCTASADHWHGLNSGRARPCFLPGYCDNHAEPAAPERCYAPRTTQPQPAAVVLPTVDEVIEVLHRNATRPYVDLAKAVLDLIAARLPAWQPVEPGAVIKAGTRYRIEWDADDTEGRSAVERTYAGGFTIDPTDPARFYVDPRTVPAEPEDPAVAAVVEWLAICGPIDAGTDDARDLLARIDAARADA